MGNDYVFGFQENASVYPIVLGDTTTILDIKLTKSTLTNTLFKK